MRTISITIDDQLLRRIDKAARSSRRTRSELFRAALREWLASGRRRQLAAEDRAGYERQPVEPAEFEGLIAAQPLIAEPDEVDW